MKTNKQKKTEKQKKRKSGKDLPFPSSFHDDIGNIEDYKVVQGQGQDNTNLDNTNNNPVELSQEQTASACSIKSNLSKKSNHHQNSQKNKSNQENNARTAEEAMKFFKIRRARTDPVKGINKCTDRTIECPAFSLNRKSIVKGFFRGFYEL